MVYSKTSDEKIIESPTPTPREEFLDYVKENHTSESNINEELVAKTIDFAGKDLKRKEEIAATVADNFTKEEIKKMTEQGNVLVIHGEKVVDNPAADAEHIYRSKEGSCEILFDKDADKTAITHEFVHHLRVEDSNREGLSMTAYSLDEKGHVVGESITKTKRFAEECAVVAETEIRTKKHTDRPNRHVLLLDKEPIRPEDTRTKTWSYKVERSTLRTKAAAVKSNETLPKYEEAPNKDTMAEGVNLRGKRALAMFDRNFRRSRLGNAPKTANGASKSNTEIIEESHKKKKKQHKVD